MFLLESSHCCLDKAQMKKIKIQTAKLASILTQITKPEKQISNFSLE